MILNNFDHIVFSWRRGGGEWHSRDGWFITGLLNWQKMLFSFKSLSNFNFIGFRAIFRSTMHGFLNSSHQLQYYNKLIVLFIIRYGAIKEPELILLFGKYATNTCFFRWKWCRKSHLFSKVYTYQFTYQIILKTLKRKRILKTQFIKDSLLSDKKCCFLLDDDNLKVREHHFDWPQWVIFLSEGSSYFPTFTSIHLCSTRENKG